MAVNGEPLVDAGIQPNQWITIRRQWSENDVVEVRFPMHLRSMGISKGHPERAALLYGPVMLAAEGRHFTIQENPCDLREMEKTKDGLTFCSQTKDGEPLCFRLIGATARANGTAYILDFTKA